MSTPSSIEIVDPYQLAELLGRPAPTAQQAALISAALEPTLVVAGAGSGKTETVAQRVVYLVANGRVAPGQVLGLTFTRKAAAELAARIRTRLRMLAGTGIGDATMLAQIADSQPLVSTYHSFAGQIIEEFGPLIGVEPAVSVLTATSSWQMVRRLVTRWDGDLDTDRGPDQVTDDVLALTSALADHLADPDDLDAELGRVLSTLTGAPPSVRQTKALHSKLADVVRQLGDRRSVIPLVKAYAAEKRSRRVVDFADQMQLAATVVNQAPQVGAVLRQRYPVVMLDEYQDTGHAQRVILRGLFGESQQGAAEQWRGHPVTAVGDPVQSIYAWRGASASNLPRFTTDFPQRDGSPAALRELLISFRNGRRILDVANAVSEPVRSAPVSVGVLEPSKQAEDGVVRAALLETVSDEVEWLADALGDLWQSDRNVPLERTAAVLLRRRASMAPIAAALRARGLPVEIVGVGGLVHEPDVADIISVLRMVVDHQSGPAAVRILTGARWRLGIADMAALARRARRLGAGRGASWQTGAGDAPPAQPLAKVRAGLAEAVADEGMDEAGLVDAVSDPGDPIEYSPEGWQRINALGSELRRLRAGLLAPLREIVSSIERALQLDIEVLLTNDGRAHLDAFADVVSDLEASGAGPVELLDYLAAAESREDGLSQGEAQVAEGRIQLLTVHAAKGLEWDIVAVPHLSAGVFPSEVNSTWLGDPTQIPPALRGDREDIPAVDLPAGVDQGTLAATITDHRDAWAKQHRTEERRLFYVAVTRARRQLLLSAHHWSATRKNPSGPGELFAELVELPGPAAADDGTGRSTRTGRSAPLGVPEVCAPAPLPGSANPLLDEPVTALWPQDPLGSRRGDIERGAARVRSALDDLAAALAESSARAEPPPTADSLPQAALLSDAKPLSTAGTSGQAEVGHDPDGWERDAALLLAERDARRAVPAEVDVPLPASVSVTALVDMATDPEALARRLHRPLPSAPAPQARRGTAFHGWLEAYFGGEPLLDLDQLPGAYDVGAADDSELPRLIDMFRSSDWAARTPAAIEVPFLTQVAGVPVRGRIDAVFTESDGSALVVDWKTGAVPGPERAAAAATQLTAYRLAWSRLSGLPLERVRAVFYYVAHDRLISPADLVDPAGLEQLIAASTTAAADG